ncbi:uncharacterized protein SAPINGB_P006345 [Magnusiomyces paraingens]|uniref:RGS domain-containing protein n=1 Tax=Magnusiomyces paraingens TaxID=2606893 RepID=A0A5E8C6M4_9ASCO|nr:uncharacterized protein SAPINGB_P006345 [Saprochaete ingens]VVT58710.1 unnamed protein product [Saprochaete ingens]
MKPKYPSLDDILADKAPHPYSLANFIGFLSQNHCLETIEFTLDVARYTEKYSQHSSSKAELNKMWQRIVDAYIRNDSPREVNLPCEIKKRIANSSSSSFSSSSSSSSSFSSSTCSPCWKNLPSTNCAAAINYCTAIVGAISNSSTTQYHSDDDEPDPPSPTLLAPAVALAKDMMKENVYIPFLASVKCSAAGQENDSKSPCFLGFCGGGGGGGGGGVTSAATQHQQLQHITEYSPFAKPPSNSSSPCSWQQPSSWESPCFSISKSSSSESLYTGDEHGFNNNISSSSSSSTATTTTTTTTTTTHNILKTPAINNNNNNNCNSKTSDATISTCTSTTSTASSKPTTLSIAASGPMTPPESPQDYEEPLRSFSAHECATFPLSKSSSTDTNSTFPQYTEIHPQQQQQVGPYRSHWRKMSKRLKWRRGSDKDSKPLPPTSVAAAAPPAAPAASAAPPSSTATSQTPTTTTTFY